MQPWALSLPDKELCLRAQSSIQIVRERWRLLSITVGQNRPHLGLCLGHNVPLQGRQGSWGCIPNSPGESGLVSREAKDSAVLSSRTGYFLDPTEWPKGRQSSCEVWREDQGLLSRSGRKRRPPSLIDGVRLLVTPWTITHQAPLSMGFSRQEYWLTCSPICHPYLNMHLDSCVAASTFRS